MVKRFFSDQSWVDKVLLSFLIYLAQIIIVGLVLGIFNMFYLREAVLSHFLILLFVILFFPRSGFSSFNKPGIEFIFDNKLLLFAVSVFLGFFAVKFYINLVNPPLCTDSLQYHLAFPAYWIKHGNLANPLNLFGAVRGTPELSWVTYYPVNAELFFAWLMLPLKNSFLADLGEAPFYSIGILTIYSILKKFSVDKTTALFSGFLWVLIPNVFKELRNGAQVDIICAVLFLLVFNILLIFKKQINFKTSLLLGIGFGIFIGTKIINIVWSIALVPMFIFAFFETRPRVPFKKIVSLLLAVVLVTFIFGGYMYIKNFINSGNPFYPINMKLFGNLVLPGLIDSATFKTLYSHNYPNQLFDKLFSEGLGFQLFAFILPGTVLPLVFYRLFKRRIRSSGTYLFLFLIPTTMLAAYLLFLNSGVTRFIFPYLGMGLIAFVVFASKFKWGSKYIAVLGLISVMASISELAHSVELIVSIITSLSLFTFLLLISNRLIKTYRSVNGIKFVAVFLVVLTAVLYCMNQEYDRSEFRRYASVLSKKESWQKDIALGWRWLNDFTGKGNRIGYVGRNEVYPLFGSGFKNEVLYVPVNRNPVVPYSLSDGYYRKEKDLAAWKDNMNRLKIDVLYIALPQKINNESDNPYDFPKEDEWAILSPEMFSLVFKNQLVHIYKVTHI